MTQLAHFLPGWAFSNCFAAFLKQEATEGAVVVPFTVSGGSFKNSSVAENVVVIYALGEYVFQTPCLSR